MGTPSSLGAVNLLYGGLRTLGASIVLVLLVLDPSGLALNGMPTLARLPLMIMTIWDRRWGLVSLEAGHCLCLLCG